ncbi:peroxiredoxin family protein [Deinococcus cellulosilyticus]|uniref:Peroxiredoxin n=1 Tax=Deinococcus cellulosilyticus (strain DSM 18568 / NBRC 106333 / KACC 11606 / 5516J-15) TaxID=1223518 RepID=A0A511N8D8_DEIC1|nr:peroxiredoxin family protein [Deinococcus cellulosilyticus]GEM49084.1 peroxiredoxin [Deinococcus cellulosilyticus NBRC 106333 = KACC 11606]
MTQIAQQTAPTFELQSSHGPVKLVDHRGKTKVLLYFMREFNCPLCMRNVLALSRMQDTLKQKGVQVIIIGGGDEKSASAVAQRFQLPFPVAADPERSVYRSYNLEKTLGFLQWNGTILIDPQGKIIYRKVSQRPGGSFDQQELQALL